MRTMLVGYTGFVGSNIAAKGAIDLFYNSKNISNAYGVNPDLLIFAGIRAEKYLSNAQPKQDLLIIEEAFNNIERINPKKIVLISTIDVYKNPIGVDEDSPIETENLHPYGLNRYRLEQMIHHSGMPHVIIRLPGLYGINLKKNFIYDIIHVIPSALTEGKFDELCQKDFRIKDYYAKQDDGFYKCNPLDKKNQEFLRGIFLNIGFSAINFTDSRAIFQFYDLSFLWDHILIALNHGLESVNMATEPVSAAELHRCLVGNDFINEKAQPVPKYDFRSRYASLFSGISGEHYIFDKNQVCAGIQAFYQSHK